MKSSQTHQIRVSISIKSVALPIYAQLALSSIWPLFPLTPHMHYSLD